MSTLLSQFVLGGGSALRTTVLTSGAGTFTPLSTPTWARITLVGGGGGGYCDYTSSNTTGLGGGGGAGATIVVAMRLTSSVNYIVGAGGIGAFNGGSTVGSAESGFPTSFGPFVAFPGGSTSNFWNLESNPNTALNLTGTRAWIHGYTGNIGMEPALYPIISYNMGGFAPTGMGYSGGCGDYWISNPSGTLKSVDNVTTLTSWTGCGGGGGPGFWFWNVPGVTYSSNLNTTYTVGMAFDTMNPATGAVSGGSTPYGSGGQGAWVNGGTAVPGQNGQGYGSGGGGPMYQGTGTTLQCGNGAGGLIIIEEYGPNA